MPKLVTTVKTSYNDQDFIKTTILAWKELFNEVPKKESVGVLYSQHHVEVGNKATYCWCNNICNVKINLLELQKDPNDQTEYCFLNNVWEINSEGQKIIYQPPSPACAFRAFPTLLEGVKFQLDLLKNKRYKTSWIAIEEGNTSKFAHLLKLKGYYTASEVDYARNMNFYFNKFMKDDTYEKVVSEIESEVDFSIFPLSPQSLTEPTEKINTQEYSTLASFVSENEPTIKSVVNPTTQSKSNFLILILNFLKNLLKIR